LALRRRRRKARAGLTASEPSIVRERETDQPAADGEHHSVGAVVNGQLAHRAAQVVLDRLLGDLQRHADLAVAHAEGGVLEHLALARRQPGGNPGVGHGVLRLPPDRWGRFGTTHTRWVLVPIGQMSRHQ
jgi:hypothetical protein